MGHDYSVYKVKNSAAEEIRFKVKAERPSSSLYVNIEWKGHFGLRRDNMHKFFFGMRLHDPAFT